MAVYKSGTPGLRLVSVHCEKCRSDFFYELARIGVGRAGGIASAQRLARADLERRLADESELVPCPRCHWINEDLIAVYRRSRYRGWRMFTDSLAIIGAAISLLVAYFLWIDQAPNHNRAWVVLIGGPVVSLGFARLLQLLARDWLRRWIEPNISYPLPPTRLPRGTPPSLVKNPTNGDYEVACPKPEKGESVDDLSGRKPPAIDKWTVIQVGRSKFPMVCNVCLLPSNPQSTDRRKLRSTVELLLPRCAACARRQKRTVWKFVLISFGAMTAVVVPVMIALFTRGVEDPGLLAWIVILSSFVPFIALIIAQDRTKTVRVKLIDRRRGVYRVRFRNEGYRKLIEMNAR
jgi:hypothetical protein